MFETNEAVDYKQLHFLYNLHSYAVLTSLVNEKAERLKSEKNISSGGDWTWKNLVSLNRLNEHVAKVVTEANEMFTLIFEIARIYFLKAVFVFLIFRKSFFVSSLFHQVLCKTRIFL